MHKGQINKQSIYPRKLNIYNCAFAKPPSSSYFHCKALPLNKQREGAQFAKKV